MGWTIDEPRSWRSAVPDYDWETYRLAGLGAAAPAGERPALLVIDIQYRTLGHGPLPLRDSMQAHYPSSCGEWGWKVVDRVAPLIRAARDSDVPVIYPHIPAGAGGRRGSMGRKAPGLLSEESRAYEFPGAISPGDGDLLVPKVHASAFAGTTLTGHLIELGVDSLILVGCTTSGCVRATAVDASSLNFGCIVVEDCVYDRSGLSHSVNLFDMESKYANVLPADQVVRELA